MLLGLWYVGSGILPGSWKGFDTVLEGGGGSICHCHDPELVVEQVIYLRLYVFDLEV